MAFELDPLDDLFSDGAANNAKPGGKFRPKAKLKPRKISSASHQSTQSSQPITTAANELMETLRSEKASTTSIDNFPGVTLSDGKLSSGVISHSSNHVAASESVGPIIGLHPEAIMGIMGDNGNWKSYLGKSEGETGPGLEVLDDCLPQSTTTAETPTVKVTASKNAEVGFGSTHVSLVDRTLWVCNTAKSVPSSEVLSSRDPLTCQKFAISDAVRDFHVKDGRLETEEVGAHPSVETLDTMHRLTTSTGEAMPETSSKINYLDEGSIPEIQHDDVQDFSYMEFDNSIPTDPTLDLPVNNEIENLIGTSEPDSTIPGEYSEAVSEVFADHQKTSMSGHEEETGKTLRRSKRVHVHRLMDESGDEGLEGGQSMEECPSGAVVNEDNHADEEHQLEHEPAQKRVGRKSKRATSEGEKPVRKRKGANEVSEKSSKMPPKKFPHSTRRRRRFDNQEWLKHPDDDIELSTLTLQNIILLGEYWEWTAKKMPQTSETPAVNQSTINSSADYYEDDPFASEQGRESNDEQPHETVQESSTYFNYHTHMKRTPRGRWTKQDTELFYEAVQQFGTDLSMIGELFPVRTHKQLKLKYKKEEREHPMRLHEAITNRSKDHSHFELVVERLKQAAAEREKNREDLDGLTGEEQDAVAPETNEDVTKNNKLETEKNEQDEQREVHNTEDIPVVQSPVKSSDSEDDYRWNHYKSEL